MLQHHRRQRPGKSTSPENPLGASWSPPPAGSPSCPRPACRLLSRIRTPTTPTTSWTPSSWATSASTTSAGEGGPLCQGGDDRGRRHPPASWRSTPSWAAGRPRAAPAASSGPGRGHRFHSNDMAATLGRPAEGERCCWPRLFGSGHPAAGQATNNLDINAVRLAGPCWTLRAR